MAVSFILWYPCLSTYAISLYRVDPDFSTKIPKEPFEYLRITFSADLLSEEICSS